MDFQREREFLLRAAASRFGIVLRSAELDADIGRLRAAQRAERALCPAIENVEVWRSPWSPKDEIWLVKTAKAQAPQVAQSGPPPAAVKIEDIDLKDLGL